MSKREREVLEDDRPPKRSKPARPVQFERPIEDIESARHLQHLLTFRQDDPQQLRNGIASCKAFLEQIVYPSQDAVLEHQLGILSEYLTTERPRDSNDTDRPFLHQLWQAWSFANSNNSDHLSSAICNLLALLLKCLSAQIDLSDHARLLCRTVLQHQHLRLIKRCLDAPKHKEFLLSPSLRLLTELTNFDGGAFAHEVYKRREQTFDLPALRKCLTIVKSESLEDDLRRRPAVRTLAARYVLCHLRLQDEGGKIDILKQRQLCLTLFSYFRNDPPELVLEILRTTQAQVLKDTELPRTTKAAILTQQHLNHVLDIATRAEFDKIAAAEALQWLKNVCSLPSYGILRTSGWYPSGSTNLDGRANVDRGAIDLGLESLDFWENEEKYQIKNVVLAAWLRTLRPQTDLKERELVLTCFKAAPELVHAYFKDNALQMDPKLTNTWIGYASFLFEVADLPLPKNAGNVDSMTYAHLPPQTSIVLNSILPKPLSSKVLTRCLNQKENLISFFVTRLLVIALSKIGKLREEFAQAKQSTSYIALWQEAEQSLEKAYIQTLPPIKDVLALFRRLSSDGKHHLQREATLRLLRLYLEVLPLSGEDMEVDVSASLVAALSLGEEDKESATEATAWSHLELQHLVIISQHSKSTRWFQKQGATSISPIISLLKLCVAESTGTKLRDLAGEVLTSNSILANNRDEADVSAFHALYYSLKAYNTHHIWEFLEDCLLRAIKAPVKYLDELDDTLASPDNHDNILAAVIMEQAPFVTSKSKKAQKEIVRWVNSLFGRWLAAPKASSSLQSIKAKIDEVKGWNAKDGSDIKDYQTHKTEQASEQNNESANAPSSQTGTLTQFAKIPVEERDHPELFRWQKKDLDQAFEDDDIKDLISCLCSQYSEIRRQARVQLGTVNTQLHTSSIEEKDQAFILIGELLETYDRDCKDNDIRLPHTIGTFAMHALDVQLDPTHFMYPKINRYFMRAPIWRTQTILSYWIAAVFQSMPSEDDSYWKEVQWVLSWLIDGLRQQEDVELLRRSGCFEKLMALYASPGASEKLVKQRILEIIYRAANIDPMTLVTRTGVLSWLQMLRGDLPACIRRLLITQNDSERTKSWAGVDIAIDVI